MWSIVTIICTSLGVGRGVWSIATVICTSLGARGVVHSDNYLYKSWSRERGGGP